MEWTWKDDRTLGVAGVYERYGWKVWSNGDYWKITNANEVTYSRGYKQVGYAMKAAERMMTNRKTQDVFVIEMNYGYGWEEEYETDSIKDVIARYKEYVDNVVAYKRGLARWRMKRKKIVSPAESLLAPVYGEEFVSELNRKEGAE